MVTRNLIKEEIDRVQDSYLEILYKIVKALENPPDSEDLSMLRKAKISNWKEFIELTYGCMADDPIYRGERGQYEIRETIR